MSANSALTREQLDANPMLESTRVENSGTMSGFTPAQIADSDMPMVMKLLTRAYTRPHEAVVRELVANALDSHRDAGVTDPVEVILPTIDNPSLTVTDCGLGLSSAEFSSTFGNVGASTKRQSLTSTGHIGIGSKSPYAIADQYQVTAVKNGSMIKALFAKTDEGIPTSKILFEGATDAGNGVSITVPVDLRHVSTFQGAASDALFWRNRGEVEVTNLDQPLTHWNDEGRLHEDLRTENVEMSISQKHTRPPRVRMGGIGYDIPHTVLDEAGIPHWIIPLIFNLAPKAAIVAPSREALEDTDSLRTTLADLYQEWLKVIEKHLRSQFESATSTIDFITKWTNTSSYLMQLAGLYGMEDIGEKLGFPMSTEVKLWDSIAAWGSIAAYRNNSPQEDDINATDFVESYRLLPKTFIVIDKFYTKNSVSNQQEESQEFRAARRASKALGRYHRDELHDHHRDHNPMVITPAGRRAIEKFDDSGEFFIFRSLDETKALVPKRKAKPKRRADEPIVFTQLHRKLHRNKLHDVPVTAAQIDRSQPVAVVTKKEFEDNTNQLAKWNTFPFHEGTVLLRENRTDATIAKELGLKESQILDTEGFVDEIHRRMIMKMSAKEKRDLADNRIVEAAMDNNLRDVLSSKDWLSAKGTYRLSAANRRDITRLVELSTSFSYNGSKVAIQRLLDHPLMPASKIEKQFPRTLETLSFLSAVSSSKARSFPVRLLATMLDADRAERAQPTKGGDAEEAS